MTVYNGRRRSQYCIHLLKTKHENKLQLRSIQLRASNIKIKKNHGMLWEADGQGGNGLQRKTLGSIFHVLPDKQLM